MASSVVGSTVSVTAAPTLSPQNVNDLLLAVVLTSGGGGQPYVTAISDTQGNTWNQSVLGTFGTTSSYFLNQSGYYLAAFYAYASATTSNTLTFTIHNVTSGTAHVMLFDCAGLATSAPLLANIYNDQSSPGTGANAVTSAGGVGSDSVTLGTAPGALIIGSLWESNTVTRTNFTAGSGFTSAPGSAGSGSNIFYYGEYERITASGTWDATATITPNVPITTWMFAFSEPPILTTPGPLPQQIYIMP